MNYSFIISLISTICLVVINSSENNSSTQTPNITSNISNWSSWFGGNGGSFHQLHGIDNTSYVTKICVREGNYIDAIDIEFNDGTKSALFGGLGGNGPYCYSVNKGECFSGVILYMKSTSLNSSHRTTSSMKY
eukprot:686630_1